MFTNKTLTEGVGHLKHSRIYAPLFFMVILFSVLVPNTSFAASLSLSPATGVYSSGKTFTVTLSVNTAGQSINAADGTISFNPRELSVVSVNRNSSIFNLWTTEPAFSNAGGTVTFSGGLPSGYNGGGGSVLMITFKALTSGTTKVSLTGASVLAADGRGTNVLTNMNGGSYTLSAVESQPTPEVIVEYVPPANTPATPVITSTTNPDQTLWYKENKATLNWNLPSDVTAVRTSLDNRASAIPTKVYDLPIRNIELTNLDQGINYFHVQFRNKDGWGKVGNYRLAIDSQKPESFSVALVENSDLSNSDQNLKFIVDDKTSPVLKFKVQLDGGAPTEFIATSSSSTLPLRNLAPGYHTVVVEAFDAAGNSIVSSFSFTINTFEKPVITDYPPKLSEGVIPVIKGSTRPESKIEVTITDKNGQVTKAETKSDSEGKFNFIPETSFVNGIYKVTFAAIDKNGAQSAISDEITIVVELPGYLKIGNFLISLFSVIIPLIGLIVLTWLLLMYTIQKFRIAKKRTVVEANEALEILAKEFKHIEEVLNEHEQDLLHSRKVMKLTQAEASLIDSMRKAMKDAQAKVQKEITDVTKIFK